jgi:hypothetical protein
MLHSASWQLVMHLAVPQWTLQHVIFHLSVSLTQSDPCSLVVFIPPLPEGGGGYTVLPLSVLPSVQDIFRRNFLSNCWWQKSDIWSQASYRYTILWVAFLEPSDSYLPVCRLSWFLYTLNIYANFLSHFSQQLLMAEIWYFVTSFI